MTQKDYILFAEMLRDLRARHCNDRYKDGMTDHAGVLVAKEVLDDVEQRMCRIFAGDNGRFNRDRFHKAARP